MLIIIFKSFTFEVKGQVLPLANVKGIQAKKGILLMPNHQLKLDSINRLFIKDSLVFTPSGNFKLCIFEFITESKTILITAVHSSSYYSSMLYQFGKREILLIPLSEDSINVFYANIKGYYFSDFDIKKSNVFFKTYKGKSKQIRAKKLTVWR